MKIAVPTRDGHIDDHFGHCAYYTIFDIEDKQIVATSRLDSPKGCGCKSNIASVMEEMGIELMLAGNMGNEIVGKLGMKNLSKGVKVEVTEEHVSVNISMNLKYGFSIPSVCEKVQDRVKTAIENMTGLTVLDVNIKIAGVNVEEQ